MQKLTLQRLFDTGKQTIGRLSLDDTFLCWTLEDTYRPEKIKHKTRISAGLYKLIFRKWGRFFVKYSLRFQDIKNKRGMIQLADVPNYSDILIHIGNYETNTSGCLLVGSEVAMDDDGDWHLVHSTKAYKKVYPIIAELMENDSTYIEIIDEKDMAIDTDPLPIEDMETKGD